MKKFKELSIGDTIYCLKLTGNLLMTEDYYKNKFPPDVIKDVKIIKLSSGKNESVNINEYSGSYSGSGYWLTISKDELELTSFTSDDHQYFTSLEERNSQLKQFILNKIHEAENKIKSYQKEKLNYIGEIRKNYFELLCGQ